MTSEEIDRLISFRKELHRYPEISHEETATARKIKNWLLENHPNKIVEGIGGQGIAAIWDSHREGPSLLFRCELDALPILEIHDITYKSTYEGKGHLCGHDGHMAILAGLASYLKDHPPGKGRVILLYQPAEETGEGGELVLNDAKFSELNPDYVFAIHNLPGFKENSLVISRSFFSAASAGLEIKLEGKSSHAAEPENGINPALAVSRIIRSFHDLIRIEDFFESFVLITVIQVELGGKAFGTSPGNALLRATLRAYRQADMDKLTKYAMELVKKIGKEEKLKVNMQMTEIFPATINDGEIIKIIEAIAKEKGWETYKIRKPFRWSEDFGHFTSKYKGAMIGLGAGKKHPNLHNPDYDFPDEIIPRGIDLFKSIYHQLIP